MRKMKDSGIEWIGEIPENWEVKPIKQILCERKESNNPIKSDFILSLTNDRGVIPYHTKGDVGNKSKEDITGYKLVYPNDIVLNSMNVVIGSVGLSNYFGLVSPVYYMLYTRNKKDNIKYFNYIFQSKEFQGKLKGYGNGIMDIRMRIPMSKLNTVLIPLPSEDEQTLIADYLDNKVNEIDNIISKTQETIEEYKKYKQSVITEAVTKGLNPNVEMKDSGIEWIGEIPKHWEIQNLNQIFYQLKNKNNDLIEQNLLSLSYGNIVRKDINSKEGLLPENFSGYNIIDKGDIVLRLTDLQNDHTSLRTGLAKERGIITSAYITLRSKESSNTGYFHLYLHSFDIYKGFYGMGSGIRQNLTYDGIKYLKVLVPPLKERQEISDFCNSKIRKIDNLITKKQELITQLESYKKSLIYEYVTGKKEVAVAYGY